VIVKSDKINPAKEWLVYILKCGDGSYYTGITNCLSKRLKAHAAGVASKYTRSRLPVKVVYLEILRTKGPALQRELKIKKLSLEQKIVLIKAWEKSKKPPAKGGGFFFINYYATVSSILGFLSPTNSQIPSPIIPSNTSRTQGILLASPVLYAWDWYLNSTTCYPAGITTARKV
jgi:putative endonuclease